LHSPSTRQNDEPPKSLGFEIAGLKRTQQNDYRVALTRRMETGGPT